MDLSLTLNTKVIEAAAAWKEVGNSIRNIIVNGGYNIVSKDPVMHNPSQDKNLLKQNDSEPKLLLTGTPAV